MITWHIPAQQPANISLKTVSLLLVTCGQQLKTQTCRCTTVWRTLNNNAHPSLLSWWRKKSFAASLMAFSGVTRVRFTAAPAATNSDNEQHVSGSDPTNRPNGELTVTVGGRHGRDLSLTSVHAKVAFSFNCLYEAVHPKRKHWCQKCNLFKCQWLAVICSYMFL